jgi:hypothetical protein
MNEEKMRLYAEFEALNEEYMALVPAIDSPLDASDSPAVVLPLTDQDVIRAIDLLQRMQAKLRDCQAIPWE